MVSPLAAVVIAFVIVRKGVALSPLLVFEPVVLTKYLTVCVEEINVFNTEKLNKIINLLENFFFI
jgi:hypothetical protein